MFLADVSSNRHGSISALIGWVALRSSWPFRWSPCGPIWLAGLHSVRHESVRHRKKKKKKMAPFQKMSDSSDRSLLSLYYFEESWQRLTHVLRLTGRTLICMQSACTNKQQLMRFINMRHFEEVIRRKCPSFAEKMKRVPSGQGRECFSEATPTLNRGGGCCTGLAKTLIRKLITLVLILYSWFMELTIGLTLAFH